MELQKLCHVLWVSSDITKVVPDLKGGDLDSNSQGEQFKECAGMLWSRSKNFPQTSCTWKVIGLWEATADLLLGNERSEELSCWSEEVGHCECDPEGSVSLPGSSLDLLCFQSAMPWAALLRQALRCAVMPWSQLNERKL